MAWINVRTDLAGDPRVERMADAMAAATATVVGCCAVVWSWAKEVGETCEADVLIPMATAGMIDRRTVPGFAAAAQKVGWLQIAETGVVLPRAAEYLGRSERERDQEQIVQTRRDVEAKRERNRRYRERSEGASEAPTRRDHERLQGASEAHSPALSSASEARLRAPPTAPPRRPIAEQAEQSNPIQRKAEQAAATRAREAPPDPAPPGDGLLPAGNRADGIALPAAVPAAAVQESGHDSHAPPPRTPAAPPDAIVHAIAASSRVDALVRLGFDHVAAERIAAAPGLTDDKLADVLRRARVGGKGHGWIVNAVFGHAKSGDPRTARRDELRRAFSGRK